jgi:hypothetical protein
MSSPNLERLTEVYLSIRDARDELSRNYEEQDKLLKQDMDEIEAAMLAVCNDISADSIRTSHGVVIRQLKERYTSSDWSNFNTFARENNLLELYEKRIHQGNMKNYLNDNPTDGLPPGINVFREYGIMVRRASSNKE